MISQPLTVATDWHGSAIVPICVLFAALAAAYAYYWRLVRKERPLPARALAVFVVAGLLVAWCSPVLFSSDVYAYAAYGELARIGVSPYVPISPSITDPLVRAAQAQWITAFPICVYGPLFVALARTLVAAFAAFGPRAQLDAFRAASSLALLLCIPLSVAAYRGNALMRLRAAAVIALNPVAIWCAAEGHNDAIALAVVLAGFAMLRVLRMHAVAIVAVAALIKAPATAATVAIALIDRRLRAVALGSLAVVVALSLPLMAGATMHVARGGHYAPQDSLQAVLVPLGQVPAIAVAVATAVVLCARGIHAIRNAALPGWIYIGLAAWVLVPNPYPWYGIWLLALAALAPYSAPGIAAIALSFTSLLRYIPDAVGTPGTAASVVLGILATLPLLAALANRTVFRRLLY